MAGKPLLKRGFDRVVDLFMPPGYVATSEPAEPLGRARRLVALLLYNVVLAIIVIVCAVLAQPHAIGEAARIAAFISGTALSSYLLCLWLFRHTGSVRTVGHLFAACALISISGACAITGGFASPALHALLIVPALAFLIAGRTAGLQWLGLTLLITVGFYLAFVFRVAFMQIIPDTDTGAAVYLAVWIIVAMTLMACFLIHDVVNDSLQRQLARERLRLAHQAAHDSLTQLPNRSELYRRLEEALTQRPADQRLALAYIDLDDFKPINDQHGHHVGDKVLQIISQKLLRSVRQNDCVARLGGDEFALLLQPAPAAHAIPGIVDNLLRRLNEPIHLNGQQLQVSASIGVVFAPEHGNDANTLLKRADQSMYQAKQQKNRARIEP